MKKCFYLILNYMTLLSSIFILGIIQGGWFDSEKMLSRNDVEIYSIPSWKYNVYYMVLCILLIINVGLVYWGGKKRATVASRIHSVFFIDFNNIAVFVISLDRMREIGKRGTKLKIRWNKGFFCFLFFFRPRSWKKSSAKRIASKKGDA